MKQTVTTTSLEMTTRSELRSAAGERRYTLVRVEIPSPALNRFLYTAVGARYCWYSRLSWDYARWLDYLQGPVETWVAYVRGSPAGYFELQQQAHGNTELAFFGLLPAFVGQGLGGQLLTDAITRAWDAGAQRVWVHTCDLDHPQALRNYHGRGFRVFKVETAVEELPDEPLEPWPGAKVGVPG
ncbi:MAG TPA: GNAT family N-acetyltransferase [Polyangiales bacterium]